MNVIKKILITRIPMKKAQKKILMQKIELCCLNKSKKVSYYVSKIIDKKSVYVSFPFYKYSHKLSINQSSVVYWLF